MFSICNDLRAHFRFHEDELFHAPLHRESVLFAYSRYGTHRAPEMIHMPHARFKRMGHFIPGGVGMTAGHQVTALACFPVKGFRTGKLRCTGCHLNNAQIETSHVFVRIRVAASIQGMTPHFIGCKERSVVVHSSDTCAIVDLMIFLNREAGVEHSIQLVGGTGCRGWKEGGRAVSGMDAIGDTNRFSGAIHIVCIFATVHVDVDVTRSDPSILDMLHHLLLLHGTSIPWTDILNETIACDEASILENLIREHQISPEDGLVHWTMLESY